MSEELDKLITLSAQLPKGLRSDWRGTNHYELQDTSRDAESLWWLDVSEMFLGSDGPWDETDEGKRVGLVLDCVAALSQCSTELTQLREKLAAAREVIVKTRAEYDRGGDGKCAVCQIGHRLYDTKGNIGVCEWSECLSHEWRKALAIIDGKDAE